MNLHGFRYCHAISFVFMWFKINQNRVFILVFSSPDTKGKVKLYYHPLASVIRCPLTFTKFFSSKITWPISKKLTLGYLVSRWSHQPTKRSCKLHIGLIWTIINDMNISDWENWKRKKCLVFFLVTWYQSNIGEMWKKKRNSWGKSRVEIYYCDNRV